MQIPPEPPGARGCGIRGVEEPRSHGQGSETRRARALAFGRNTVCNCGDVQARLGSGASATAK